MKRGRAGCGQVVTQGPDVQAFQWAVCGTSLKAARRRRARRAAPSETTTTTPTTLIGHANSERPSAARHTTADGRTASTRAWKIGAIARAPRIKAALLHARGPPFLPVSAHACSRSPIATRSFLGPREGGSHTCACASAREPHVRPVTPLPTGAHGFASRVTEVIPPHSWLSAFPALRWKLGRDHA